MDRLGQFLHDSIMPTDLRCAVPFVTFCEPGWSWSPPPLPDFDLWTVLDGRGELRLGADTFELRAGRSFVLQPGDTPRATHDRRRPLVVFACHFQFRRHPAPARLVDGVLAAPLEHPDCLRRNAEEAVRSCDQGPDGRRLTEAIVWHFVVRTIYAARHASGHDGRDRLAELASRIRSRPAEMRTLRDMARQCGLSIPQFTRRFRAAQGCSPAQYVIRHRILRAMTLLRESDMSIAEIAEAVGYHDIFFFHRQFRARTGATPRAIRLGAASALDAPGEMPV